MLYRFTENLRRESTRMKSTESDPRGRHNGIHGFALDSTASSVPGGKSTAISFIFRRCTAAPKANKVLLMSSRHSYLTAS